MDMKEKLENVQALQNLTVLDLTRVVAGPYAGSILGDFGAHVIKIEVPGNGDDARGYGPYENGESMYYANLNRNKKGITLNLKTEEGKKILLELVKKADILLENYRPGVMDKLGVGYEVLHEVNPRLIMALYPALDLMVPILRDRDMTSSHRRWEV